MKLTSELPNWISWPLRFIFYGMVIFILYHISMTIIATRLSNNFAQCSGIMHARQENDTLRYSKEMIRCLESKNSLPENILLSPVSKAVKALPNNPDEFVGTWRSSQPHCDYLFELYADGEFFGKPISCSITSRNFRGVWGIYEDKMVWLYERFDRWQPDINDIDVVSNDTFLLLENDGQRTLFTREQEDAIQNEIDIF